MNDIIVNGISKSYEGRAVLKNFSCAFPAGSTTCVMGPSGCGKTTLMRILLGLETADTGEILMDTNLKMACVFQEDRLIRHLSAGKNCLLVSDRDPGELLKRLGLEEAAGRPVRKLSGGMARRVSIARALIYDADLVVMDEPLKGLDEKTRAEVIRVIKEYTSGKTLILVTHDPEEAALLGGNLLRME